MSLVVGLTGGIATGKSTVSRMFADRGAKIVDADQIARLVVEPGTEGLRQVVEAFGERVLQGEELNRKVLGSIIFSDEKARLRLNQILHPLIRQEMFRQTKLYKKSGAPVIIWDVPLLFESKLTDLVKKVIVVYVSEEVQLQRLQQRDELTKEEAIKRIRSQISIDKKKKLADYVIDNQGPISRTESQVDQLWNFLVSNSGLVH